MPAGKGYGGGGRGLPVKNAGSAKRGKAKKPAKPRGGRKK